MLIFPQTTGACTVFPIYVIQKPRSDYCMMPVCNFCDLLFYFISHLTESWINVTRQNKTTDFGFWHATNNFCFGILKYTVFSNPFWWGWFYIFCIVGQCRDIGRRTSGYLVKSTLEESPYLLPSIRNEIDICIHY